MNDRLAEVHMLPCVACWVLGETQASPTEAHHMKHLPDGSRLVRGHKRADDEYTIPLCSGRHHWNGVNANMALRVFEALVGKTEPELWEITNQWLDSGYPDTIIT